MRTGLIICCLPLVPIAAGELPQVRMSTETASPRPREVLFLGRQVNSHHSPTALNAMMQAPWAERNLRVEFTARLEDLNAAKLSTYDAVFVFGNAFSPVTAAQETALVEFADAGGGVAALHVACWSLPHSAKITSLIGGAFLGHHAIQSFSQEILPVAHPILEGLGTYTSVDEPYLFKDLAADRLVLTMRNGPGSAEPMTWVRNQGQGRVFYHSGGHDARTWQEPNFQELVNRGIEWVAKPGGGGEITSILSARIGEGGAMAVRALVEAEDGGENLGIFTNVDGVWSRPVLEGEEVFNRAGAIHAPKPRDMLRVGGAEGRAALVAMAGAEIPASGGERGGLWSVRGGLAEGGAMEGSSFAFNGSSYTLLPDEAGSPGELVMNADGACMARISLAVAGGGQTLGGLLRFHAQGGAPQLVWVGEAACAGLSMNGPGHVAACTGDALLLDSGAGFSPVLSIGGNVAGLPDGAALGDLRDVRMNDAGDLVVAADLVEGGVSSAVLLRRVAGAAGWEIAARNGPQAGWDSEIALALDDDDCGAMLDSEGRIFALAGCGSGKGLVLIQKGKSPVLLAREGAVLTAGDESLMVSSLGAPADWTCGGDGVACGRITAADTSGEIAPLLMRWHGRQASIIARSGEAFPTSDGEISVTEVRVDGGGTPEDGHGGFMNREGEWLAVMTDAAGAENLVQGKDLGDLDSDGMRDFLEVALGSDPDNTASVPIISVETGETGAKLVFLGKTGSFFSYRLESSLDLQNWQEDAQEALLSANQSGAPLGYSRMELNIPALRKLVRLRVKME